MEKIKVIIKDTYNDITFVELTEEQWQMLNWMDDRGLLNDVSFNKADDAGWETI